MQNLDPTYTYVYLFLSFTRCPFQVQKDLFNWVQQ